MIVKGCPHQLVSAQLDITVHYVRMLQHLTMVSQGTYAEQVNREEPLSSFTFIAQR